jgi:hypothetical protein
MFGVPGPEQIKDVIMHDVLGVGLIIGGLLGLIFAPGILGRILLGLAPIAVGILLFMKVIG